MSLFEYPTVANDIWLVTDEDIAELIRDEDIVEDDHVFPPLTRNASVTPELHKSPSSVTAASVLYRRAQPDILYSNLIASLTQTEYEDDDEDEYEGVVKKGNIILDMDGTLGDNIPAHFAENPERYSTIKPIPRPGLRKFFRFVFSHYERVSIWTAALPVWYNKFKREVLQPNMPPGAAFHFERTRTSNKYVLLKPLSEIYATYPEYNETNTVIVDDNPMTFASNSENAIHIKPFFYDRFGLTPESRRIKAEKDKGLYELIHILKGLQSGELTGFQVCNGENTTEEEEDKENYDDLYN